MATSTSSDSGYKTGLIIVAAMVVVGAILAGILWTLEVPGGQWTVIGGGVVGAILGFVAVSYFMYGR